MSTVGFEELEGRLRATFDEMIPQLIEQVGVVNVVPDRGASASADVPPARRWIGVGALAIAASVVALAFVVGRNDRPTTTGGTDVSTPATADVPTWYPILRAAVPERFVYLALTAAGIDGVTFVAIDPSDGKALEIVVFEDDTGSVVTQVTCDVDKGTALFAVAPPTCESGDGSQVAPAELEQIRAALPAAQLRQIVESPAGTLDGQAVAEIIAAVAPRGDLLGHAGGNSDVTLDFGAQNSVSTRARVVAGVYPRPTTRTHGSVGYYDGLPAFWTIDPSGYAVRFTSADYSAATVRSLQSLADRVLDQVASQSTAPADSTTSTLSIVQPGGFTASYGPMALGDGTTMSVRVDPAGLCTVAADGQIGGCDGLAAYDMPAIVLWGNDHGTALQTVYGIVQVGYTLSITKGDGSPDTPVTLTPPQRGWSAYAFQQPVGSKTTLVVTDATGNNVDFRSLCC